MRLRLDGAAWRFGAFLAVIVAGMAFAVFHYHGDLPLSPEQLRDTIRRWGHFGPLIFAGIFIIRPFIFFPSRLLFVVGGVAFGAGWGGLYAAIGATVSALFAFGLSRVLGREFVEAQLGDRLTRMTQTQWGIGVVWLLYLIPIVPMTAVNYGAGLSRIAPLPFALAAAAGIAPRAFAYSFFGQSLGHLGSGEFVISVVLLGGLLVIPLYLRRYFTRRAAGPATPP